MTLANNYSPTKTLGNGTTTEFTFNWDALSADYVKVYFEDVSSGVQTEQTTGFTVTLNSSGPGGKVIFTTVPTSSEYVIIARKADDTQETSYTTSDGFQASVIENDYDKRTAVSQQQQEEIDRSLKLPLATSGVSTSLPRPSANKILGWNSGATAIENKTLTITETQYDGTISRGNDADKPSSPDQGDVYYAEDTKKTYHCYITGIWSNDENFSDVGISGALSVSGACSLAGALGIISSGAIPIISGACSFKTLPFVTNATPTYDGQVANKKYVDSNGLSLGTAITKSVDTVYQADTDGFVYGYVQEKDNETYVMLLMSDSSNPPTTEIARAATGSGDANTANAKSFCAPIKKGDYWKAEKTGAWTSIYLYWIPLS